MNQEPVPKRTSRIYSWEDVSMVNILLKIKDFLRTMSENRIKNIIK